LTKFGADFVEQSHDKPFFLALGIFRPHSPQIVPQEFIDMYPLDQIKLPELPADDMNDIPAFAQTNWSSPFVKIVKEKGQLANAIQGYLASVTFADACVGQFMDALNKSKYKDNTIVILVTDHGFQLGHKNRWEKFSLWKQGTNVPMIIRMPDGMIKPGITKAATSMLDIYPTIVELLGIESPIKLQGTSLVKLLKKSK
jgi:arylsulfatase A-like enzyme